MKQKSITLQTEGFSDIIDLSDEIDKFLSEAPPEGLLNIFVPGSTAGVTTLEYEPGCVHDLQEALEEIAPADKKYKHNERWGDGNGFSHLRAALLGPSLTVPYKNKELQNGTWQQVVLVDCDNRSRKRDIIFSVQQTAG